MDSTPHSAIEGSLLERPFSPVTPEYVTESQKVLGRKGLLEVI